MKGDTTMKKFQYTALLLLAALALIPVSLRAADDTTTWHYIDGDKYKEDPENVFLSKSVTPSTDPEHPDEFTITLKAFVGGKKITTMNEVRYASDIVLVLDCSGSMGSNMTIYKYTAQSSKAYNYKSSLSNLYYLYNGTYCKVSSGRNGLLSNHQYYMYFTYNNTRYYLSDTGVVTSQPTNVTSQNGTIWTGVLYSRSSSTKTKLELLKTAAKDFINTVRADAVADNNGDGNPDNIEHRVSIVRFSSKPGSTSNGQQLNRTICGLTSVLSESNINTLNNGIDNLTASGDTYPGEGLRLAYEMLSESAAQNKVVVMFTDGNPAPSGTDDFDNDIANAAINQSKAIKAMDGLVYDAEHNVNTSAKVYSVGLFSDPSDQIKNFMSYVSSNYPNATSMTNTGDPIANPKYSQVSSGSDLSDIFTSIAQESSTGGATTTVNTQSIVTVDVLSTNFELPSNVLSNGTTRVRVFTDAFDGLDNEGKRTFKKDWQELNVVTNANNKQQAIDDPSKVFVSIVGKEIQVLGFNYGENWCGFEEKTVNGVTTNVKHGNELIIQIPIVVDPDNPGGASLLTNTTKSGLYENESSTDPISRFEQPILTIPNIIIRKFGLQNENESATFRISRMKMDADGNLEKDASGNFTYAIDPDVKPFSIVLTNKIQADQNPYPYVVAKIKLQSIGYYMVEETNWSLGYTPVVVPLENDDLLVGQPTPPEGAAATGGILVLSESYEKPVVGVPTTFTTYSYYNNNTRAIVRQVNEVTQIFLSPDYSEEIDQPDNIDQENPDEWLKINKGTVFNFYNAVKSGPIASEYHEDAILNVFKPINTLDH